MDQARRLKQFLYNDEIEQPSSEVVVLAMAQARHDSDEAQQASIARPFPNTSYELALPDGTLPFI